MSVKPVEVVGRSSRDSLPLSLLSCELWMFVTENADKKNIPIFLTCSPQEERFTFVNFILLSALNVWPHVKVILHVHKNSEDPTCFIRSVFGMKGSVALHFMVWIKCSLNYFREATFYSLWENFKESSS